MTNSLKILASLGCLLAGCDNTSVDPIQLSPRSTGLGGATGAAGGTTAAKSTGPASGGASLPKGGSGTGGASSSSSTGGSTSTTPGTGGATFSSCLIIPTADTGWVDRNSNDCKVQGAWYSYNDCSTSTPPDCTEGQTPEPGTNFPNTDGVMCTSGTTVPVGTDYQKKWGAGIALNLNQEPGKPDKFPISSLPKSIKGFSFTLSGETIPAELRVNFPTAATATAAHYKSIRAAGDYVALFSEAQQPSWVSDGEKVALVPSNVVSIEFQVVGNPAEAVPFSFCVARLSALY